MQGFQPPAVRLALLQRVPSSGQHCPAGTLPGDSQSHNKRNAGLHLQEARASKSLKVDSKAEFLRQESKLSMSLGEWLQPWPEQSIQAGGFRGGSTWHTEQGTTASLEGSLHLLCQEQSIHLIDLTGSTASLGWGAAAGDAECWPTNAHISLLQGCASICTQNSHCMAAWASQNYLGHILLEMILLVLQQAATLLRLANSIFPILSDFFLMKLNNSFICYVISFPSGSSKTNSVES